MSGEASTPAILVPTGRGELQVRATTGAASFLPDEPVDVGD
jgi:hypothetical protein